MILSFHHLVRASTCLPTAAHYHITFFPLPMISHFWIFFSPLSSIISLFLHAHAIDCLHQSWQLIRWANKSQRFDHFLILNFSIFNPYKIVVIINLLHNENSWHLASIPIALSEFLLFISWHAHILLSAKRRWKKFYYFQNDIGCHISSHDNFWYSVFGFSK